MTFLKPLVTDKSWTLFLDRDGVINRRFPGDYVKHKKEFEFLPGVKSALKILAEKFGVIVVVTNQQGIGKKLMTDDDLAQIHEMMLDEIYKSGGRIDAVYYAPHLSSDPHHYRKPLPTMALMAKNQFHSIDFAKSIMVGDTAGDMEFGRNCGMFNVYVDADGIQIEPSLYDMKVASLPEFVKIV